MNESDGKIWYALGLNNTELERDAQRASGIIRNIGNTTEAEGARIENIVKKMTVLGTGFFTMQKASGFISDMVKVRGEFQQLEIAFETMLGSKSKADALMSQMVQTAAKTPFDLIGVAQGAKQLLAYGTSADKVNDTLLRLGNIASGLSIPLNDLVYLYGTTQVQGRLFAHDVRQFMGRGIPLVQQLSKELGKTEEEINAMVTAGKIGFPEVQRVINNLTNEGGMFFNLMEKQSASVTGQLENLKDAIDVMFNDMGKSSENIIYSTIEGITYLVENYEKVGKILLGLVATYGAYKAAIIIASQAEAGWNIIQLLHYNRLLLVERAQKLLNATMLSNPYVLVTVAVVALVATMWALHDSTTAQEKAQKRLNEITEAAKEKKENLENEISRLTGIINSETKTILDQIIAYKELQSLYPKWLKDMDMATFKAKSLQEQQLLLNQAVNEMEAADLDSQLKTTIDEISRIKKELLRSEDGWELDYLHKQLDLQEELLKGLKNQKNQLEENRKEAEFRSLPEEEQLKRLNEQLSKLEDQKRKIEEITNKAIGLGTPFEKLTQSAKNAFLELTGISSEITKIEGLIAALTGKSQPQYKNESFYQKQKKDAEDALKSMDKSQNKSAEWIKQKSLLDEANKNLKTWDFSSKTNSGESAQAKKLKEQQDQADLLTDLENKAKERNLAERQVILDLDQAKLDLQEEGFSKQQAQIELNHKKELLSIEHRGQELVKKQQETERLEWEKNGKKGIFTVNTTTESQLTGSAKDELDEKRKFANEKKLHDEKKLHTDLVREFEDYHTKRQRIGKEYDDKIKSLEKGRTEANKKITDAAIAEAKRQKDSSLAKLDSANKKITTTLTKLFGDMKNKSVKEMRAIVKEGRDLLKFLENINNAYEFNSNGDFVFKKDNPFGITEEQYKKLKESPDDRRALKKEVEEVEVNANKLDTSLNGVVLSFGKMKDGLKEKNNAKFIEGLNEMQAATQGCLEMLNLFGSTLGNLGELTGSGFLSGVSSAIGDISTALGGAMQGAASGGLAAGPIGAAVGGGLGLVSSITGIFGKNKKHREELRKQIAANKQQEYFAEFEINRLWRQRYEWAQKIGESTLNNIKRQGEALSKQAQSNSKEQSELWDKLMNAQYVSGERFKRTGLFGTGKGKIVQTWSSLAGKSWEEIEKLATSGKLSAEGQSFYEALKAAREEGDNLAQRQEEYLEKVREIYTGSSYDSVVNGIVDGFKSGKRTAADFVDSFAELMQNAVSSSLKLLTDEKMRKWYENFAKMGEDGYTDSEIADAKKDYLDLIEQLAKDAEAIEKVTGITIGDNDRQATAKGVATASQDSVNELNGRFGVIQTHTYTINENVKMLAANSAATLKHLAKIETNTFNTHERLGKIETQMTKVSDGIKFINDHGIVMKKG